MDLPHKLPSDRSFGLTFAVVLGALGAWLTWRSSAFGPALLVAAAGFALLSIAAPRLLHWANVAWLHFGLLLGRVVTPVVMGVLFFGVFTIVATIFRLKGRDSLRRRFEPEAGTYWIERKPPGPAGSSLPRQF